MGLFRDKIQKLANLKPRRVTDQNDVMNEEVTNESVNEETVGVRDMVQNWISGLESDTPNPNFQSGRGMTEPIRFFSIRHDIFDKNPSNVISSQILKTGNNENIVRDVSFNRGEELNKSLNHFHRNDVDLKPQEPHSDTTEEHERSHSIEDEIDEYIRTLETLEPSDVVNCIVESLNDPMSTEGKCARHLLSRIVFGHKQNCVHGSESDNLDDKLEEFTSTMASDLDKITDDVIESLFVQQQKKQKEADEMMKAEFKKAILNGELRPVSRFPYDGSSISIDDEGGCPNIGYIENT